MHDYLQVLILEFSTNFFVSHTEAEVATGWTVLGSNPSKGKILSFSQKHPERL